MQKTPAPQRYIVYHETIHGDEDLEIDMRRKSRAGQSSHCEMALGDKTALNSNKLHSKDNSIHKLH